MRQTARVVSQEDFDAWLADAAKGEGEEDSPTSGEDGGGGDGKAVFTGAGCGACHTLADAATQATVGPILDDTLEGIASRGSHEDNKLCILDGTKHNPENFDILYFITTK
jgi:mono/diheme cytochrome c family protein